MSNKETYEIVANSINVKGVPKEINVLPLGHIKSQKGDFIVDSESFKCINSFFKDRSIDIVVDYEHQTLTGKVAPAAGWIKELSLKSDGIYGKVEWTDKAKEMLSSREYKYLSPVILIRGRDKKVVRLQSVALTNSPAIDGMRAIVNSSRDFDINNDNDVEESKGADSVEEIKKIAIELGLEEQATVDDIVKAIKELKTNKEDMEIKANKLEMKELKNTSEQLVQKALSIGKIEGNQKEWALNRCIDDIEGFKMFVESGYEKECNNIVTKALSTGKITPYQEEWAKQYALKDYEGFNTFVKQAIPVVPMGKIALKNDIEPPSMRNDSSVSRMLNVDEKDIQKYNKRIL